MESRFNEKRHFRRYSVSIPATVKINTHVASFRLEINDATIIDIGYVGIGLSMVVETVADHDEIARMFTRHRTCQILCRFPGNLRHSRLAGRMVWFQPRMTSRGFVVRFGVLLEGNDDDQLGDMKEFLSDEQKRNTETQEEYPPEPPADPSEPRGS